MTSVNGNYRAVNRALFGDTDYTLMWIGKHCAVRADL